MRPFRRACRNDNGAFNRLSIKVASHGLGQAQEGIVSTAVQNAQRQLALEEWLKALTGSPNPGPFQRLGFS